MLTSSRSVKLFAAGLAGLAGVVDAIAFLQLGGFFVSFMSGNSTRLGVGIVEAPTAALLSGALLLLFVVGVTCGSLLARRKSRRRGAAVLAATTALVFLAAWVRAEGAIIASGLLLAMAMGCMNATFERDGETRFGLTYMTGALVKVGQGLASAVGGGPSRDWIAPLMSWLGLILGAACGTMLHTRLGGASLWVAGALAFACALGMTAWEDVRERTA